MKLLIIKRPISPGLLAGYVLAGILFAFFSIWVTSLPTKHYAAVMGIVILSFPLLFFFLLVADNTRERLVCFSVFTLGIGIPFNLDYNFFYRDYVGVTSFDISVTLLSAMMILLLLMREARLNIDKPDGFRFQNHLVTTNAILLYILACFLSLNNAEYYTLSFLELGRMLELLFLYFIVSNLKKQKYLNILALSLALGMALEGIIAVYQWKTGHTLGLYIFGEKKVELQDIGFIANRASGTIGNPNILGYYFEILIPFVFALFIAEKKVFFKLFYMLSLLLGCAGIYATLSRGAWMTLPISSAMIFLIMFKDRLLRISTAIWAWVLIMLAAIILVAAFPTIQKRFTHYDYGSANTRGPLNEAAFSVVKQFPVFGVGINNLAKVFKKYDQTGYSAMFVGKDHVVHNMYFHIWTETGTVGLLAFLSIFISVLWTAFLIMFKVSRFERAMIAGFAIGIVAQLLHASVDPGFKIMMNVSMLVYTAIGVIAAIHLKYKNEQTATKTAS
jgi:O-antigen ligase